MVTRTEIENMINRVNVKNEAEWLDVMHKITRKIDELYGVNPFGQVDGKEPVAAVLEDMKTLYSKLTKACISSINKADSEKTEVLFNFRVPQGLRDDFNAACEAQDTTSAQSIRAYMREVVDAHNIALNRVADAVTEALNGRDSMLVPISDLVKLSRAGGAVGAYVDGIIFARLSLKAAGVEK